MRASVVCRMVSVLLAWGVFEASPQVSSSAMDRLKAFLLEQIVKGLDPKLPSMTASECVEYVERLLAEGHQDRAETLLEWLVLRYPNEPRLWFQKAVCTRSRFPAVEEALKLFDRVVELSPNSPEGLASDLARRLDRNEPLTGCSRGNCPACALRMLADAHRDDAMIQWLMAIRCRALNWNQEGIVYYRRLEERWPVGPVLFHQTFANLLDEIGGHQESLQHRRVAVRMVWSAWTVSGLGVTLEELGRPERALEMYDEALKLYSGDAPAIEGRARVLRRLGRLNDVVQHWEQQYQASPRPDLGLKWVYALAEAGQDEHALRVANDVLRPWMNRADVKTLLADLQRRANRKLDGTPLVPKLSPETLAGRSPEKQADRREMERRMFDAAATGDAEGVRQLLQWGVRVDATNELGDTALHLACRYLHPQCVQVLLNAGAKLNWQNVSNETPLVYLVADLHPRRIACLEACLKAGADPNEVHNGEPIWWSAVLNLNFPIADRFAAVQKFDVNARGRTGNKTALMRAVQHAEMDQSYRSVRWLLDHGADPNLRDSEGLTPLMLAVRVRPRRATFCWPPDAVELLLDRGADPNLEDRIGMTALDWAAWSGLRDAANYFASCEKVQRKQPRFPRWRPDPSCTETSRFLMALSAPWVCLIGGRLDVPAGHRNADALRGAIRLLMGVTDPAALAPEIEYRVSWWIERGTGKLPDEWFPDDAQHTLGRIREHCWTIYRDRGVPGRSVKPSWTNRFQYFVAHQGTLLAWSLEAGRTLGWLKPDEYAKLQEFILATVPHHFSNWNELALAFDVGYRIYSPEHIWRLEYIVARLRDDKDPNNPWGGAVPLPKSEEAKMSSGNSTNAPPTEPTMSSTPGG